MNFTGKMSAAMNGSVKSMKNGVHNTKIEGQIEDCDKQIRIMTREIGNLTVLQLDNGLLMSDDIMERYEKIKDSRQEIQDLKGNKSYKYVVCPHCGRKTIKGMKYCGHCGQKLV